MKLSNFNVTFRNILFREVVQEKTASGLYLPTKDMKLKTSADMFEQERVQFDGSEAKIGDYVVVKTGKDCTEIQPGDIILLVDYVKPILIPLDEGLFLSVSEQQIVGYNRN